MKKYLFLLLFVYVAAANDSNVKVVARVIDGDTFVTTDGMKVRLLGIDTPELGNDIPWVHHTKKPSDCFAIEAYHFTRSKVQGKQVKLTYELGHQRIDKYGRTLAWVWYSNNGTSFDHFLNGEIVHDGYGFSYRRYPTGYLETLNAYEAEARKSKRGLWNPEKCKY